MNRTVFFHFFAGFLTASRSKHGRTWGASISLLAFLLTQWLLPNALFLQSVAAQQATRTEWRYDAVGRVIRKTFADTSFEGYAYDTANRMLQRRDARNRITKTYFDEVGNLSRVDNPDAPDVSIFYDALNRPYEMRDGIGSTKYAYDALNRVTSIDGPWANDTQTFNYKANNQRDWMRLQNPQASSAIDEVRYTFDGLNRLQTLASTAGTFGFGYVGNTGLAQSLNLPNGTKASWSYDGLNRLSQVSNTTATNALISRYNYGYETPGYEKRSVRTWQEQRVGTDALRRFDYNYDRVNQLKGEKLQVTGQSQPSYDTQWNYDAMGNRTQSSSTASVPVTPQAPNGLRTTSASYTPNALNQWVSGSYAFSDGSAPSASTCSYDVSGNLVQQTNTQGSGAQTTTTGSTQYAYDSLDRLGSITTYNPGTGVQQHQSVFLYDGLNRKRIAREADWQNGAWVQSSEVRYLYDGLDVIQERDANNQVLASYTRAGNIGGLLARTTWGVSGPYGTTPGSVYFHYDGAGNVSQLSDSSGATVAKYAYDAWGNAIEVSGAGSGVRLHTFRLICWGIIRYDNSSYGNYQHSFSE